MPIQEYNYTLDPRTDIDLNGVNSQLRSLTHRERPIESVDVVDFQVIGFPDLRSVVLRLTIQENEFFARTVCPLNGASFSTAAAPGLVTIVLNDRINPASVTATSVKYNGLSVAVDKITIENEYVLNIDISSLGNAALQTHTIELLSLTDTNNNDLTKQDIFSWSIGTTSSNIDRGNPEPYTKNLKRGDFKVARIPIGRYENIEKKLMTFLNSRNIDRESVIFQDILNINESTLELYVLYFSDLFPMLVQTFPNQGALLSSKALPSTVVLSFSDKVNLECMTQSGNMFYDNSDIGSGTTISADGRSLIVDVSPHLATSNATGTHLIKVNSIYNQFCRVMDGYPTRIGFSFDAISEGGGTTVIGGAATGITGIAMPDGGTQIDGVNNPLITMSGGDAFISVSGVSASEIAINFDSSQITFPPGHVDTSIFDNPGAVISDGDGTITITGTLDGYVSDIAISGAQIQNTTFAMGTTGTVSVTGLAQNVVQSLETDLAARATGAQFDALSGEFNTFTGDFSTEGIVISDGDGSVTITGTANSYVSGVTLTGDNLVADVTILPGAIGNLQVSHQNIPDATSVDNNGDTVVQDILTDSFGHVTGQNSYTITPPIIGALATGSLDSGGFLRTDGTGNVDEIIATGRYYDTGTIDTISGAIQIQVDANDIDITNIISSLNSGTGAGILYVASGDSVSKFDNDAGYWTVHSGVTNAITGLAATNNNFIQAVTSDSNGHLIGITANPVTPVIIGALDTGDLSSSGPVISEGDGSISITGTLDAYVSSIAITGNNISGVVIIPPGGTGNLKITGFSGGITAETDPIFSVSVASKITTTNTANWSDAYVHSTGTGVNPHGVSIGNISGGTFAQLDTAITNADLVKSGDNISFFNNDSGYINAHPPVLGAFVGVDNVGTTVIQSISGDSLGHMTGATSLEITPPIIGALATSQLNASGFIISYGTGTVDDIVSTGIYYSTGQVDSTISIVSGHLRDDLILTGRNNADNISINSADISYVSGAFIAHTGSKLNPHDVTAGQVGAYTISQVDTISGALSGDIFTATGGLYTTITSIGYVEGNNLLVAGSVGRVLISDGSDGIGLGQDINTYGTGSDINQNASDILARATGAQFDVLSGSFDSHSTTANIHYLKSSISLNDLGNVTEDNTNSGALLWNSGGTWVELDPTTSGYILATQDDALPPHWVSASDVVSGGGGVIIGDPGFLSSGIHVDYANFSPPLIPVSSIQNYASTPGSPVNVTTTSNASYHSIVSELIYDQAIITDFNLTISHGGSTAFSAWTWGSKWSAYLISVTGGVHTTGEKFFEGTSELIPAHTQNFQSFTTVTGMLLQPTGYNPYVQLVLEEVREAGEVFGQDVASMVTHGGITNLIAEINYDVTGTAPSPASSPIGYPFAYQPGNPQNIYSGYVDDVSGAITTAYGAADTAATGELYTIVTSYVDTVSGVLTGRIGDATGALYTTITDIGYATGSDLDTNAVDISYVSGAFTGHTGAINPHSITASTISAYTAAQVDTISGDITGYIHQVSGDLTEEMTGATGQLYITISTDFSAIDHSHNLGDLTNNINYATGTDLDYLSGNVYSISQVDTISGDITGYINTVSGHITNISYATGVDLDTNIADISYVSGVLTGHTGASNPHNITAATIGAATGSEVDVIVDDISYVSGVLTGHTGASNPHGITASTIGAATGTEVDVITTDISYVSGVLTGHTGASNPHGITLSTIGGATGSDVDLNTVDISYVSGVLTGHTGNLSNPHVVTVSQIGAYSISDVDSISGALSGDIFSATGSLYTTITDIGYATGADLDINLVDISYVSGVLTGHTGASNPHGITLSTIGAATGSDVDINLVDISYVSGVLTGHTGAENPHSITLSTIGAATGTDIDVISVDISYVSGVLTGHTGDLSNPHNITAATIGAATGSDLDINTTDISYVSGVLTGHTGDSTQHFTLQDSVVNGDASVAVTPNAVYDYVHSVSGVLAGAGGGVGSTTFTGLTDTPSSIVDGTFYYGSGSNLTGFATGASNAQKFLKQGNDGYPEWANTIPDGVGGQQGLIGVDTTNIATGAQLSWDGTKFVTTTGSADLGGANVQFLGTGGTIEYRRLYVSDIFTTGFYGPGTTIFADPIRTLDILVNGVSTTNGLIDFYTAANSSQAYYETDYINVGDMDITSIELGAVQQVIDGNTTGAFKTYAVEVTEGIANTSILAEQSIVFDPGDDGLLKFATIDTNYLANYIGLKNPRLHIVYESYNVGHAFDQDIQYSPLDAISVEVEYTVNDVIGGGSGVGGPRGSAARTIPTYYQKPLNQIYLDKTVTGDQTISGSLTIPAGKTLTITKTPGSTLDAANKSYVDDLGDTKAALVDFNAHTASGTVHFTEGSIDHTAITNIGTNTHAQIDTHIASTANPHATDIGNLGGGTLAELNTKVTDATLDDSSASRPPNGSAGGDLSGTYPNPTVDDGADGTAIHDNIAAEIWSLTEKATPVSADLIVIEDSAALHSKKKVQIGNLPSGGGGGSSDLTPAEAFAWFVS